MNAPLEDFTVKTTLCECFAAVALVLCVKRAGLFAMFCCAVMLGVGGVMLGVMLGALAFCTASTPITVFESQTGPYPCIRSESYS